MARAMMRRAALTLAAAALVRPEARAQAWPSRPIRIVVPFPPGGMPDVLARTVAPHMTAVLG